MRRETVSIRTVDLRVASRLGIASDLDLVVRIGLNANHLIVSSVDIRELAVHHLGIAARVEGTSRALRHISVVHDLDHTITSHHANDVDIVGPLSSIVALARIHSQTEGRGRDTSRVRGSYRVGLVGHRLVGSSRDHTRSSIEGQAVRKLGGDRVRHSRTARRGDGDLREGTTGVGGDQRARRNGGAAARNGHTTWRQLVEHIEGDGGLQSTHARGSVARAGNRVLRQDLLGSRSTGDHSSSSVEAQSARQSRLDVVVGAARGVEQLGLVLDNLHVLEVVSTLIVVGKHRGRNVEDVGSRNHFPTSRGGLPFQDHTLVGYLLLISDTVVVVTGGGDGDGLLRGGVGGAIPTIDQQIVLNTEHTARIIATHTDLPVTDLREVQITLPLGEIVSR